MIWIYVLKSMNLSLIRRRAVQLYVEEPAAVGVARRGGDGGGRATAGVVRAVAAKEAAAKGEAAMAAGTVAAATAAAVKAVAAAATTPHTIQRSITIPPTGDRRRGRDIAAQLKCCNVQHVNDMDLCP